MKNIMKDNSQKTTAQVNSKKKPHYQKIVPILVLLAFCAIAYLVTKNPPVAKTVPQSTAPQLMVEVQTLKLENITLALSSYGTVKPRTQSSLLPQVSGQIIEISPKFREGGFFEKGDVLAKIDARDYEVEIKIAQATLFSAKQALSEEQARVEQALQDWQRLGNSETAPDLVLRKPQLLAAQASVLSAQAALSKKELALERTNITAPYSGRILTKFVDIGHVVSTNTQLAEIYATDYVEIRLPVKNNDLPYIDLPESSRFHDKTSDKADNKQPSVVISSDIAVKQHWQGRVVRTEGAFDQSSQQLFVVAHIDDPYGINNTNAIPIKIGQYVSAQIQGKNIKDALVIPNKAIYQGSYVYLVEDRKLIRTTIDIAWQNEKFALIKSGLSPSQLLVLTPLGQVTSGTIVRIAKQDGVAPEKTKNNTTKKQRERGEAR